MIMSVEELLDFIDTDKSDSALRLMLEGLEALIAQYTNNAFKNRVTDEVEYPASVKMAVVEIMRWKLRNEAQNSADDMNNKPVQSETLSRHLVTYAQDASETDIDARFGVPKKYTAVFKLYQRARF